MIKTQTNNGEAPDHPDHPDYIDATASPIQLLVNYWEIRPSLMAEKLNELLRNGVSHVATFIPWQAVESDISHRLMRFLQHAGERRIKVSLILTPEVGVHYPNSGLPKDVIQRPENQAKHSDQGAIAVNLAPNAFGLPSLFSPELTKRYYGFLSRMDSFLADLGKTHSGLLDHVTVILTGSYWKYYRSPLVSARHPFGGIAGDFSNSAGLAYRQVVDQFFAQREFTDPTPAAANRWKTQGREDINRKWFYQQSEDVFRNRSFQLVRRKAAAARLKEVELFTPEADPSVTYSYFLQMISGAHADFFKLSALIDEAAARTGMGSGSRAAPFIHWTSMGGFRTFSDSEKQFLILKSLLTLGGKGGGLFIDEREWFALSPTFRTRTEGFARLIAQGDLRVRSQAAYLTPHLWSSPGKIWDEMFRRLGPGAQMISSTEVLARDNDIRLAIVDPSLILTRETIQRLAQWARAGKTVVLPRSSLYTEAAKAELEALSQQTKHIEVNLGVPFRLHALGDGKVVIYEVPENAPLASGGLSLWQTFLTAILSVAEIQTDCSVSDNRASVIPMESKGQGRGLFVLNGTRGQVMADLVFPEQVVVSDFAAAIAAPGSRPAAESTGAVPAARFSLEVPPFGILPLAIEKPRAAQQQAALTTDSQHEAPQREKTDPQLWN